jgi:lipoprotein-anchoring transpeptidase ErfK/SrfK
VALASGCQRGNAGPDAAASAAASGSSAPGASEVRTAPATFGKNSVAAKMPEGRPMLGITSYAAIVYAEPRDTSKRIGYLRVGAKVPRSDEPAGTKGCPNGWYEISPKGFVCVGKDATLNLDDPILEAASVRPDLAGAMPYRYGFVRAVLPLYLRVPTAAEQEKSEFKLKDHLDWYETNKDTVDKMDLGAFDVALDERGVPIPGKALGELGVRKNSTELGLGILFGGKTEDDPVPAWLAEGKRAIPNISDFAVPEYAVFADRARRFSGLGLVGAFKAGDDAFNRRFAITTDLRLAPTTKLKPDSGSPWHGVELESAAALPLAFVREQGVTRYSLSESDATKSGEAAYRSLVHLTGKQKKVAGERYLSTKDGDYVRASDVGLVVAPSAWPKAAESGEKWIEVSLSQQTLTMWEGKRPIYATLVSTGKEEHDTVTGTFRIRNKHITATMDSDEKSELGGSAPTKVAKKSDDGPAKSKTDKPKDKSKGKTKGKDKDKSDKPKAKIPTKGDGEYGITKRRGEGLYQLRDVPYIQYFASGFALHAAYWHDVFGKKRSHGCVNLSPIDAHRVFMWTEPAVPDGWHGINTGDELGEGTIVIVHE